MRARETLWFVTFNGAEARWFAFDPNAQRAHEVGAREVGARSGPHRVAFADRAGRVQESASPRRSAMAPRHEPQDLAARDFVAGLIGDLEAHAAAGDFDALLIAAAPEALGVFRALAPDALRGRVRRELDRDFTHAPLETIAEAAMALTRSD